MSFLNREKIAYLTKKCNPLLGREVVPEPPRVFAPEPHWTRPQEPNSCPPTLNDLPTPMVTGVRRSVYDCLSYAAVSCTDDGTCQQTINCRCMTAN